MILTGLPWILTSPAKKRIGSEEAKRDFRPAGAKDTTQPQNLAGPHGKGSTRNALGGRQTAGFQDDLVAGVVDLGIVLADIFADHRSDNIVDRNLRFTTGPDHLSATQDRDFVNDPLHFIQPVRNIKNGASFFTHPPQELVQMLDFRKSERCGRFVENDRAGIRGQCLGDFDQLLLGDGQIACYLLRVEIDFHFRKNSSCLPVHGSPVDSSETSRRQPAEKDVFGN